MRTRRVWDGLTATQLWIADVDGLLDALDASEARRAELEAVYVAGQTVMFQHRQGYWSGDAMDALDALLRAARSAEIVPPFTEEEAPCTVTGHRNRWKLAETTCPICHRRLGPFNGDDYLEVVP